MIKLNSKKWKKYPFYQDKKLVGLTPKEEGSLLAKKGKWRKKELF
jgi:hypothetical protein